MMERILLVVTVPVLVSYFLLGQAQIKKKLKAASAISMCVLIVSIVASILCWLVQEYILIPYGATYLGAFTSVLVATALTALSLPFVMWVASAKKKGYESAALFIAANIVVITIWTGFTGQTTAGEAILSGIIGGTAFALANILFIALQQRLESSPIPKSFSGLPIALISAGLISLALMGLAGMINIGQ